MLSSSSNWKYIPTLPIILFFRGGVPEMFVTSYSVSYCRYNPGNRDFVFIIIERFLMSANSCDTFWLADRIRLFVHYTISLASLCKLIWRHWMPAIHYMGLCVFSLPISLVMIEGIYTLYYYHHQIGSINYHSVFRVRSYILMAKMFVVKWMKSTWYGKDLI